MRTLESPLRPRLLVARMLFLALATSTITVHAQNGEAAETKKDGDTDGSADADAIVVTGSRIQRSADTDNSPRVSIEREDITRRGIVNAEQLVREMPQAVAAISSGVNLANPGVSTVDLRGLRAERTLTLVDGKRFMSYDSNGVVDINNIPTSLLERIDIVTGGASTVYGSDAMAGVVNFILRKDFEGLELNGSFLSTEDSDGLTKDIGVTAGKNFADGRGNVTLFIGWTDRDEVGADDRGFSQVPFATDSGEQTGSIYDTQGTLLCSPNCFIPGGDPVGDFLVSFDPQGNLAPTGSRRFNYNPYTYLQVPQERLQGAGLFHFDINERAELYGRLSAVHTRIDTSIAPSTVQFANIAIPLSSPFLSNQARAALSDRDGDGSPDAGIGPNSIITDTFFARRSIELGPRLTDNRTTSWQALTGLKGTLSGDWRWDVSLQYGRNELKRDYSNDIDITRVQASILGCPPGSPAGCVAGNFFGDGNLSADAARFIALSVREAITNDQTVFGGSLSGTLGDALKIPGASPIGVAVGAEYREEKSSGDPDQCLRTPGCSGGFGLVIPVRARYDVKEIFGELLIPLLEERLFAHRLNLETGARLSDYSSVGRVSTYKAGGDWAPLSSAFRVRAMYQKAVRAPNIFEFGSPRQSSLGSASADPCAGNVGSAALRALCIATGVPASVMASNGVPNVITNQINTFIGGNPNLEAEDSDTFTAGFVWTPREQLPGLNVQLDWFRIEIDNAISTLSANEILNSCYSIALNPGSDPGSAACGLVFRNPTTGGLVGDPAYGLSSSKENIALLKVEGVDFTVAYDVSAGDLGNFRFSLFSTYIKHNERQSSQELPVRECAGYYGSTCGVPDPKLRFVQSTTWTLSEFDLGYRWRYLKGTTFDNPAAATEEFRTIGDYQTLDLLLGWTPSQIKGLRLNVGINNAFDKQPPLVGDDAGPTLYNNGNTYPGTFDALGRSFFVSARKHF